MRLSNENFEIVSQTSNSITLKGVAVGTTGVAVNFNSFTANITIRVSDLFCDCFLPDCPICNPPIGPWYYDDEYYYDIDQEKLIECCQL